MNNNAHRIARQVEAAAKRNEEAGNTRLWVGQARFEAPGTSQPRRVEPRVRATENAPWDRGEGRSQRAERRAAEKAATPTLPTLEELLAKVKAMPTQAEVEARRGRLAQRVGNGRDDFRWRIDRETGEAEYIKYFDKDGVGWQEV
jgi:hypothetical protein